MYHSVGTCPRPSPSRLLGQGLLFHYPGGHVYTHAMLPSPPEACFRAHTLHSVRDEAHLPSFHGRVTRPTLISANGSFLHKFYREGMWEASHFLLLLTGFLTTGFIPLLWNWLLCYQVPCTRTANSLYYLVLDCKQHSVLTCSNTSYLCHPLGKHRYPISATDPTNSHVLLVPAVNVTLLSDNRAWSQNRGRG